VQIDSLTPAVPKRWLLVIAGLMWSAVGLMLCRLAYRWLLGIDTRTGLLLGALGGVAAVAVYRFGFLKIARKNIDRVCRFSGKRCLFAFQAWKSYLIIALMIALGVLLRHSAIPRHLLAVIYETIGGALFLSSLHYYLGCRKIT
jgi:fumarate reductase subunit D